MDFMLVFPIVFALLSTGLSDTPAKSCHRLCPAGYHKVGDCDDPTAKHKCEKCANNTFTDIENYSPRCQRCDTCNHNEFVKEPCSFKRNVVCDCTDGYYSADSDPVARYCQPCPCEYCKVHFHKKECKACERCASDPKCRMKCTGPRTNPSAAPSSTMTTENKASNSTLNLVVNPQSSSSHDLQTHTTVNQVLWLFLVGVVMTFLLLFWLLLLFIDNPVRYTENCPCWSANKDLEQTVEEPKINHVIGKSSENKATDWSCRGCTVSNNKCKEHCSHQGSNPTAMMLNTSEETPMLSQSSAKPDHPAHITPLLAGSEHKAARQDEQSEQWPAMVLYAIIKEVPLRRWKEFLRLLSVDDQQLERVELEAGLSLGSMERQYQMLRLWSQRSSASLSDIFSVLRHMDLSGCAQLLQERLEKLQTVVPGRTCRTAEVAPGD